MTEIHNDIIVEIDEKIRNQEKQDLIETWRPLRDGNLFKGYLKSKDEISEKDKETLEEDTIYLLGRCINPNKPKITNLDSTGVGFGQIQSGKTTSMEAVFHLAADNNFKILILLTGYVGPLVDQNTGRLKGVLEDRTFEVLRNVGELKINSPANYDILNANLKDWLDDEMEEKDTNTLVILSMKNPSRIRNITKLFNDVCSTNTEKFNKIPVLIIDDESDHHSLNTKASKNDPENKNESELYEIQEGDTLDSIAENANLTVDELCEINPELNVNEFENYIGEKINLQLLGTATHFAITNLRKIFKFHSYIGYSATPNETLLISTFNNLRPSFGRVLEPGEKYTGLEYFFSSQSKIDRFVREVENNISEYEEERKRPDSFQDAYIYFLTCVAGAMYLGKDAGHLKENMSMIIHPSQKRNIHEIYLNWIKGLQDEISIAINDINSDEFKELEKSVKQNIQYINKHSDKKIPEPDDKFWKNFRSSKCLYRTPVLFNSQYGRIPEVDYKRYANILVGGAGLDRGLTVKGLTVTYLSRSTGNRQEATVTQRGRFFGYQGNNSEFLRIYMTNENQNFFEAEYEMNELNMKQLRLVTESEQNLKDWQPTFFGKGRGNIKIARPGILSDNYLINRSEPYKFSIRSGYSHLLNKGDLEINQKIYEILTTNQSILKNTKKLNEISDIYDQHPWTKSQNISVIQDLSLNDAMKFLTEFKFDPRDYDRTLPILTLFRNFLNPIQNKKDDKEAHQNRIEQRKKMLCPIFIFNHGGEDNHRKPYSRKEITSPDEIAEGRVTTASGENTKFKDNFHKDKTLFPGDRRVHWDFLKGISNDEQALNNPSIQIHELNITTGHNGTGKEIAAKVPYVSFFMPRSIFMESTISVNKRK